MNNVQRVIFYILLSIMSVIFLPRGACSAPEGAYLPVNSHQYKLGPEDIIEVWMPLSSEQGKFPIAGIALPYEAFGNEIYSKNSFKIDPYGNISIPLVGEVRAVGLTIEEFERHLEEKLRKYIINPYVSVKVTDYASFRIRNRICILGEVLLPGVHTMPIGDTLTVTEAVSLAGGYKEGAYLSNLIVVKKDPSQGTVFKKINFNKALKGNPEHNVILKPGDVVYLPKSLIAHIDTFVDFFFSKTDPVLKYYLDIYDIRKTIGKW